MASVEVGKEARMGWISLEWRGFCRGGVGVDLSSSHFLHLFLSLSFCLQERTTVFQDFLQSKTGILLCTVSVSAL